MRWRHQVRTWEVDLDFRGKVGVGYIGFESNLFKTMRADDISQESLEEIRVCEVWRCRSPQVNVREDLRMEPRLRRWHC